MSVEMVRQIKEGIFVVSWVRRSEERDSNEAQKVYKCVAEMDGPELGNEDCRLSCFIATVLNSSAQNGSLWMHYGEVVQFLSCEIKGKFYYLALICGQLKRGPQDQGICGKKSVLETCCRERGVYITSDA